MATFDPRPPSTGTAGKGISSITANGTTVTVTYTDASTSTYTQPVATVGLITGLTGGSNNSLVYQKDATTCADLHVSMLDELNTKNLLWKDNAGQYWLPGSLITDAAGSNLTVGNVRVMQPQTGSGVVNYRDINPASGQPSDLVATVNQDYVEFGRILNATQWRFIEPKVDGLTTTPTSRYDSLLVANYPRNSAISTSRWLVNQWTAFDAATNPTYAVSQTQGTNYPHGASIGFTGTTSFSTRIATDQLTAQAADGQVQALLQKAGGNGTIGVGMRLSGTSTTKSGILLTLDDGQPASTSFRLVAYSGNVGTNIATHPSFALTHGSFYRVRLECEGTLVRGKAWLATDTEPTDWMLVAYQSICTTAGYYGITANIETVNVTSYSTVINKGADAALTGVT